VTPDGVTSVTYLLVEVWEGVAFNHWLTGPSHHIPKSVLQVQQLL